MIVDRCRSGQGHDTIFGEAGNDSIYGDRCAGQIVNGAADTLSGGNGHDLIYGDAGHDWLFGDAGNDTLYGNDGDDCFWGRTGNDVYYGGAGSDLFLFDNFKLQYQNVNNMGIGHDVIKDFNPNQDVIGFWNFLFNDGSYFDYYRDMTITNQNGGVMLSINANDSIFIEGITKNQLNFVPQQQTGNIWNEADFSQQWNNEADYGNFG